MYRTTTCELRIANLGQTVTLAGWVQLGGQHQLPILLVLGNDLQQDLTGQVTYQFSITSEGFAIECQHEHILDGDVAGNFGVVQTTVGVLLDNALYRH